MDERDPGTAPSDPGLGVDETSSRRGQVLECGLDRSHRIGDVVQTLTILGQELPDRGLRTERLQQLDE